MTKIANSRQTFKVAFLKKNAHFFDVWSKRKLPFRNANFFSTTTTLTRSLMHNFAYLQYSYPRKQSKGYKECILLYFGNVGHPSSLRLESSRETFENVH